MAPTQWVSVPSTRQAARWSGDWAAFLAELTPSVWGATYTRTAQPDGSIDVVATSATYSSAAANVPAGSWLQEWPAEPFAPGYPAGIVYDDPGYHSQYARYQDIYAGGAEFARVVTTGSDGRVVVPLPAGLFGTVPAVTATVVGGTDPQGYVARIESATASSVTLAAVKTHSLLLLGAEVEVAPGVAVHVVARAVSP